MLSLVLSLGLSAAPVQPSVEAGTWFPALVGGRVSAELPLRLRASVTLGVMPQAYLDATQSVLVSAGAYDETTAALIRAALENALLFRVQVGWRPFAARGFYFELGYGVAALGGGLTGAELVTALAGKMALVDSSRVDVQASSVVHQVTLEVGWQWFLWRGLFLRASLGGFVSFAAKTDLSAPGASSLVQQSLEPALVAGEQYLDGTITTYVHAPVVGVSVGWAWGR